jgi:membrane fusion protein (multidrug efflux system)
MRAFLCAVIFASTAFAQQATPVIVAEVRSQPLREELTLVGLTQPRRSTHIASESEGIVHHRPIESGQSVEKGTLLYQLSNEPLSASLAEAQADFSLRKATYARSSELFNTEAISEQTLLEDEYELDRARAKLEGLASQVSNLNIRAPFSGHIVQMRTEIGAWIGRGQSVAHLVSTDTMRVIVNVPERHVSLLKLGTAASVEIAALGGVPHTGRIVAILAEGYAESHTFPVAVEIDNPQGLIRSNMSAEVHLQVQQSTEAILVHKDALIRSADGETVFLAVEGKAVSTPVQSGLAYSGFVAVEGELKAGDLAVVRGNERLRDGQDVRILRKHQ